LCALSGKTGEEAKIIERGLAIFFVGFIFLLDRVSKLFITYQFSEGEGFVLLPGIFHITRVNNAGAAFGILKDHTSLLAVISILCVTALFLYLAARRKKVSPYLESAWLLIIGGALGNLYDRLRYGYVIDFLDFRVWPVFNFADIAICAGTFLIISRVLISSVLRRGSNR
jgi:signal peptidase II